MIRAQRFGLTRICGALRVGLAGPASSIGVRGGEALNPPVGLVLDVNIGIHVFFVLSHRVQW